MCLIREICGLMNFVWFFGGCRVWRFQNYRITKLHACMCMFFVGIYRMMGVVVGLWGVERWEMLFVFLCFMLENCVVVFKNWSFCVDFMGENCCF